MCPGAKDPNLLSGKLCTPVLYRGFPGPASQSLGSRMPAHLALCFGTGQLPAWTLLEVHLPFYKLFLQEGQALPLLAYSNVLHTVHQMIPPAVGFPLLRL